MLYNDISLFFDSVCYYLVLYYRVQCCFLKRGELSNRSPEYSDLQNQYSLKIVVDL